MKNTSHESGLTTNDPVFIENNICSIHDRIINDLIHLNEILWAEGRRDDAEYISKIVDEVFLAKQKGIKIERRLKLYMFTIRALGFSRNPDKEEIEIVDNQLRLIEKKCPPL